MNGVNRRGLCMNCLKMILAQALEMSRPQLGNWKMVKMLPRYFIKSSESF
jgi:hypothetical protein